nr:uroporphyrinogen-III synthase [uncultured Methanosphaera sp.]
MLTLKDKKVVVTRPIHRAQALVDIIKDYGGDAVVVPTLELKYVKSDELVYIAENIETFDWIIFTSPAGVKSFFDVYDKDTIPAKVAAIGIKTEEILNEYNITCDMIPDVFTAEGLIEEFSKLDIKGMKIALPRTLSARKVLPDTLKEFGANVFIAEAYTSAIPDDTTDIKKLVCDIIDSKVDIITFTSPLTVSNLFNVAKEMDDGIYDKLITSLSENITVASIGPITGQVLKDVDVKYIEPDKYTTKDMIDAVVKNIN